MAKQKQKGIRLNGNAWMVDVTVDGKRNTKSGFKSWDDAKVFYDQLFTAKKNGADVDAVERSVAKGTRTLKEAYEKTYELRWKETKGEKTAIINADDVIKYFGENKKISEIDSDALTEYKNHVLGTGNKPATCDKKLSALSTMLRVATEQGWIADKIAFKNHLSKQSKQETTRNSYLTDDDERDFLNRIDVHAYKDVDSKWHLFKDFVQVCIDTGLRTYVECLSIQNRPTNQQSCIQWHNNTILVPAPASKNGKARAVPMTPRVKRILKSRIAKNSKTNHKVFSGLTKDSIRYYWDVIRAEMGWQDNKNYSPYICRHTCASRLVMRGASLPLTMQWMGHTQWSTTLGYAHLAPSTLNSLASLLDGSGPKVIDATAEVVGVETTAKLAGVSK